MKESETTKNTLYQLEEKLNREHWGDIQLFEEEDNRYSIAVGKAILLIKELEQYREIGTVEEFKVLKEKNVAKKQGNIEDYESHLRLSKAGFLCCSRTNKAIRYPLISFEDLEYCPRCGQKLDWE